MLRKTVLNSAVAAGIAMALALPATDAQAQRTIERVESSEFKAGERLGLCVGYFAGLNWLLIGLGDAPEVDEYIDLATPADNLYRQLLDKYRFERNRMAEADAKSEADYVGGYIQAHEEAIPNLFSKFAESPEDMPQRVRKLILSCNNLVPPGQRQQLNLTGGSQASTTTE